MGTRLAFLIASLNDLDILAADITNAYLNAPVEGTVWSRFLQRIGIARWIVELRGYHEISILSQHQAMPRENHLEALYHVYHLLTQYGASDLRWDDVW